MNNTNQSTKRNLITAIYVDVECPEKDKLYEGNNSVPYKRLYNHVGLAVGKAGLICPWSKIGNWSGDGYVSFLINCYREDADDVKQIIEAAITNETQLKIRGVEIEEQSWLLEDDLTHRVKEPGSDWTGFQPIPEEGDHRSFGDDDLTELFEKLDSRRQQMKDDNWINEYINLNVPLMNHWEDYYECFSPFAEEMVEPELGYTSVWIKFQGKVHHIHLECLSKYQGDYRHNIAVDIDGMQIDSLTHDKCYPPMVEEWLHEVGSNYSPWEQITIEGTRSTLVVKTQPTIQLHRAWWFPDEEWPEVLARHKEKSAKAQNNSES